MTTTHPSPAEQIDRLEDVAFGVLGSALAVALTGAVVMLLAQLTPLASAAAVICAAVTLPAVLVAAGAAWASVMCDVRRASGVRRWWADL